MEILIYRILNDQQARSSYGKLINKIDTQTKAVISDLFIDIKRENLERFGQSVNEILE